MSDGLTLLERFATQGPPGPVGPTGAPGDAVTVLVGAAPIGGHSFVVVGDDGKLVVADCTDPTHLGKVIGMLAGAYAAGAAATVQKTDVVEHSGWAWTPSLPLVVASNGQMSHSLVVGAQFSQTVAFALSPTRILLGIQPPITVI